MNEFKPIPKRGDRVEIPERFFSDVLPNTTNLLELKISLIILNGRYFRLHERQVAIQTCGISFLQMVLPGIETSFSIPSIKEQ